MGKENIEKLLCLKKAGLELKAKIGRGKLNFEEI